MADRPARVGCRRRTGGLRLCLLRDGLKEAAYADSLPAGLSLQAPRCSVLRGWRTRRTAERRRRGADRRGRGRTGGAGRACRASRAEKGGAAIRVSTQARAPMSAIRTIAIPVTTIGANGSGAGSASSELIVGFLLDVYF